ncbi:MULTISPECIES: DUF424 domain-containing protein [Haloarcula]|uniref:DUF424 domain-containing protein n=1 Tax=Haloarcula pellucida TaxID=1427151 RepID=A0A830GIY7_9EURY|nr:MULTISPECIES: DUF424 domain-containing protein [Halomicroarcula]MBX0348875.1 DUF424 domain-containing protein [Halomicroarcula pellucida]MDS0278638.1 DUF424 domain-containing protein [Halomicroarcula sp. S1AR25-4]QIO21016.1 DUF424 domain-containing protein [Haloarcula sp. JP-L23]GGN91426.1 hypothetical protein GCM10009030_14350 [Halomicroarcula pellucida]
MILNERETDEGLLVSVCDPDIIGETFEDGPVSLTVDEEFYGGDSVSEEEVIDSLARCSVANIVGEESVHVAVEHGFVDETNVLDVDGTRHAQLLWL